MRKVALIFLMISFCAFSPPASAEVSDPAQATETPSRDPVRNAYVGALIGPVIFTSDTSGGSNNYFTYGGRVGFGVSASESGVFSLGAVVNTVSTGTTISGVKVDQRVTTLMAEGVTRKSFGTGLYLGGRFGIAFTDLSASTSTTSIGSSGTSFAVGPVVGYEILIVPQVSIDLDVSWITRSSGSMTFPSIGKLEYGSASAFFLQGGLLVHF